MSPFLPQAFVPLRGRPAAILGVALAVACGLGILAGPVSAALDAQEAIARAREILVRTRGAASQGALPAPLWAGDQTALVTAFRARLDALAAGRAVVLDDVRVEPDPARPAAPRLAAVARGTTEGLHQFLLALETQAPFVVIETADLTVARAADADEDRPTVMQVVFTTRGFLAPAKPAAPTAATAGGPAR